MAEDKRMTLDVHYVKNDGFSTALANGCYGGLTVHGLINMNIFVERPPLPKKITYSINPDHVVLDNEETREGKNGIVREIPFGIIMDVNTAKIIQSWLSDKIKEAENLLASQQV